MQALLAQVVLKFLTLYIVFMFTRRKILLALLEACGGELQSTDMEKLLFAYCKENGENHYDFFPYKYGCFSFLSYQDKRVLTKQGFLTEGEHFKLGNGFKHPSLLAPEQQKRIESFAQEMKHLRRKHLIHHIYMKYPYYAIRSRIKEEILNAQELRVVEAFENKDQTVCLMTVGYEGKTIDAYIDTLIRNNVALVVDVRRNPLSMKYGFSKTRLRDYLDRAGIKYEHIPALGIESAQRKNLETEKDYKKLFKKYAAESLPYRTDELQRIRELIEEHRRVALTCFEANPESCHRHKITEHFRTTKKWSTPIKHL
jgi:uncharacterized protein (DUF488 family)